MQRHHGPTLLTALYRNISYAGVWHMFLFQSAPMLCHYPAHCWPGISFVGQVLEQQRKDHSVYSSRRETWPYKKRTRNPGPGPQGVGARKTTFFKSTEHNVGVSASFLCKFRGQVQHKLHLDTSLLTSSNPCGPPDRHKPQESPRDRVDRIPTRLCVCVP